MVNVNPGDVIYKNGQIRNIESALMTALAELNSNHVVSAKAEIKQAIGIIRDGNVVEL
jgi:hypothetical protein